MSAPEKPWKVEYAKSGRSRCRTCKRPIYKEVLRLGKMVQAKKFDGLMPMWSHARCILKKARVIKFIDDVEDVELLRWEDQQKIRTAVEKGGSRSSAKKSKRGSSAKKAATAAECGIEVSQTSRATCKLCKLKIMKEEVRIFTNPDLQGVRGLSWHHATCYLETSPSTRVDKLFGWESLQDSDQAALCVLVEKGDSEVKEEVKLLTSTHIAGTKRKGDIIDDQKSKLVKFEGDVSTSRTAAANNPDDPGYNSKLEAQCKELWALKDDLKEHVTTAELREMLKANGQDSAGAEVDLLDRCADGMLYGALGSCPLCSGSLRYSGGMYRCNGYLSEWSKCSYSSREPERCQGKWKVPEETDNLYLSKWFKSQNVKKSVRILPPQPSNSPSGSQAVISQTSLSESDRLRDLKVVISGLSWDSTEKWKNKIRGVGGSVHAKITQYTQCLVVSGRFYNLGSQMNTARRMKIPIVKKEYLVDCFKQNKKLPYDLYKVGPFGGGSSMVTVKVKGRSAVHESCYLQHSGHILEEGKSIYNTTLNMSDLSTGINSYYILQIIEDDRGSGCHVFRKWGRIGNEEIGGQKLKRMSKPDAICEFKRLFHEKTGNPWEAWEQKIDFQKMPGRFYPLDIDYGVSKQMPVKKSNSTKSKLAHPLVELMKMLFDVETYRAAMMEFKINMSEMPLGKLSKSHIQKGFEALTEIQNLLYSNTHDPSVKQTLIIAASNKFFTVIPSIHPRIIMDEDDLKSKVKMLEALQDIEIASKLVGFDAHNHDSLDEKYKKLHCDINPLPRDSEDYGLVEKYLITTLAPTHNEWVLELEELFSLEREGEYDKFAPYREKLNNKMLLWHGSRLTNFVGILSQGLRIAPPEAPATGYMFGKGVYFADMVSKSAQYCCADEKNPVGLILLSEVVLGEVNELKQAKYMDEPPMGKSSTKGLGRMRPLKGEYVQWRDGVVVPCGRPAPSKLNGCSLMYNEYIVYDTAQVKMQFLLKVRFHYKAW